MKTNSVLMSGPILALFLVLVVIIGILASPFISK